MRSEDHARGSELRLESGSGLGLRSGLGLGLGSGLGSPCTRDDDREAGASIGARRQGDTACGASAGGAPFARVRCAGERPVALCPCAATPAARAAHSTISNLSSGSLSGMLLYRDKVDNTVGPAAADPVRNRAYHATLDLLGYLGPAAEHPSRTERAGLQTASATTCLNTYSGSFSGHAHLQRRG